MKTRAGFTQLIPGDDDADAASVAVTGGGGVDALVDALRDVPREAQVAVVIDDGRGLAAAVAEFARVLAHSDLHNEQLVEAMFTVGATVWPAAARQAQRNAAARQELAEEFGLLDSEDVAKGAGSTARNRSATASRWLAEKRIFAVDHQGSRLYPGFQFAVDGRPRPVIKRVLEVFKPYDLDGWSIALWFTTATGWLGDRRPVDALTSSPDQVIDAARQTFDDITG